MKYPIFMLTLLSFPYTAAADEFAAILGDSQPFRVWVSDGIKIDGQLVGVVWSDEFNTDATLFIRRFDNNKETTVRMRSLFPPDQAHLLAILKDPQTQVMELEEEPIVIHLHPAVKIVGVPVAFMLWLCFIV